MAVLAAALTACSGGPDAKPSGGAQPPGGSSSAVGPAASPFADSGLRGFLAGRTGRVTAALYDGRTGQTWQLHQGLVQPTASIVKVQIMAAALRQAEVTGRPLPAARRALVTTMIERSDNQAATAMLAAVGGASSLRRFDVSIGMNHTVPSAKAFIPGTTLPGWGLTTTTAADQLTLLGKFAYPNPVLSARSRLFGLRLMENIEPDQRWGVTGGVPAGVAVALKNGWVPLPRLNLWQVNSIGWVSGQGRDYLLAVLTEGNPSEAYGIATIDEISRKVWALLAPRG
jgi:beta-lactamase class A